MNTRTAFTLGACLCLVSLGISAQTVVDGDVEAAGDGYVNTGGLVLKTGLGECLQTGTFSDDNTINKCAGIEDEVAEVEDVVEEVGQAAVEEAPSEPAPTPTIDTREFSELALFEIGSSSLTDEGRAVMGQLFDALNEFKGITAFRVTGHTDSTGSEAFNQALSEQRAATVAAEISSQYPGAQIEVVGLGESSPVASNDTAQGRQQNRRVEIDVTTKRMVLN